MNNAGIVSVLPLDATDADFEKYWRAHVMGSFHPIRAACPHFQAQGRGQIVNTTSGAALYG